MFLDLAEMTELGRRRFEVDVPARAGYGDNKRRAETKLIEQIDKELGIETHHGDFVFSNKRIIDAETEKVPRLLMTGRWYPPMTMAVLRGGSKDGNELALPSPRFDIQYSMLAPGWQEHKEGGELPKVWETYALAGWDTTTRQHVFYLTEEIDSDHLKGFTKYLNATV